MRRFCALLLVMAMATALFAACVNNEPKESDPSASPTPVTSDYSETDFTGEWRVSQVLDSLGAPVSGDKLKDIGADYTIEILAGGMYIICGAEGKEIGQGEYSLEQDKLIFKAAGGETIYTIRDENTIQSTAADGSVTVMTRTDTQKNENGEAIASPDDTIIESAPTQSP